jgi:hypothetical protein
MNEGVAPVALVGHVEDLLSFSELVDLFGKHLKGCF